MSHHIKHHLASHQEHRIHPSPSHHPSHQHRIIITNHHIIIASYHAYPSVHLFIRSSPFLSSMHVFECVSVSVPVCEYRGMCLERAICPILLLYSSVREYVCSARETSSGPYPSSSTENKVIDPSKGQPPFSAFEAAASLSARVW